MVREKLRLDFFDRLRRWANRLDVEFRSVAIRRMKTKWASCSTAGRLTFDAAILQLPEELQDYVIVHELLHLRVPNHGRLFKSLMRAYLGDYENSEARLRQLPEAGEPLRELNIERNAAATPIANRPLPG